MRGTKNPNVDIKIDGNDVIVTDEKIEFFSETKNGTDNCYCK